MSGTANVPRIVAGMKCYTENGRRVGWFVAGDGYEHYRLGNRTMAHHRLLAYAWGIIDSLDDPRDIDHQTPLRWLNIEENLEPEGTDTHPIITQARSCWRDGQTQLTLDGGRL